MLFRFQKCTWLCSSGRCSSPRALWALARRRCAMRWRPPCRPPESRQWATRSSLPGVAASHARVVPSCCASASPFDSLSLVTVLIPVAAARLCSRSLGLSGAVPAPSRRGAPSSGASPPRDGSGGAGLRAAGDCRLGPGSGISSGASRMTSPCSIGVGRGRWSAILRAGAPGARLASSWACGDRAAARAPPESRWRFPRWTRVPPTDAFPFSKSTASPLRRTGPLTPFSVRSARYPSLFPRW